MTNLVKRPKYRPRTQSLTVATKNLPCCFGAIDDNDGLIAQLNLVHCAILLTPLSIFFCGIVLDVWNVAYNGPVGRSGKALDASSIASVFVGDEI
jgi:hypothetical protein